MKKEEWRTISLSPSYQVSSYGKIRKISTGTRVKWYVTKNNPYPYCILYENNKSHTYTVHRLVALAFLGDRPDGMVIDHIDDCVYNMNASNLHYITVKENAKKEAANNPNQTFNSHYLTREELDLVLKMLKDGCGQRQIGEAVGVRNTTICRINCKLKRGEIVETRAEQLARNGLKFRVPRKSKVKMSQADHDYLKRLYESGCSIGQLHRELGVSKGTISEIVHGKREPSVIHAWTSRFSPFKTILPTRKGKT